MTYNFKTASLGTLIHERKVNFHPVNTILILVLPTHDV